MREATGGHWEVRAWQGPAGENAWQHCWCERPGIPTFVVFKELLEAGSLRVRISYDVARPSL